MAQDKAVDLFLSCSYSSSITDVSHTLSSPHFNDHLQVTYGFRLTRFKYSLVELRRPVKEMERNSTEVSLFTAVVL